jgi:hypothetical protein
VTPLKDPREMTDAELEAVVWKQYEALGITDKDVADAAARLQAREPGEGGIQPGRSAEGRSELLGFPAGKHDDQVDCLGFRASRAGSGCKIDGASSK